MVSTICSNHGFWLGFGGEDITEDNSKWLAAKFQVPTKMNYVPVYHTQAPQLHIHNL